MDVENLHVPNPIESSPAKNTHGAVLLLQRREPTKEGDV